MDQAQVSRLHRALTNLDPKAIVLLGGSYSRGEQTTQSDIDYYFVASFCRLAKNLNLIRNILAEFPELPAHCALIPAAFFKRGWYFVQGKTIDGTVITSKINSRIIKANCLKLSIYYFLLAYTPSNINSKYYIHKSAEQFNALVSLLAPTGETEPKFVKLSTAPHPDELKNKFLEIINQAPDFLKFSWSNYLIYNLKFIPKLDLLWVLRNPDKMLVGKLVEALNQAPTSTESLAWIKKYVFPIYLV